MLEISAMAKYENNTSKQQAVSGVAAVISPPVLGDAVKKPENIFVQAVSANAGNVTIGFDSSVTAGGAGIELPPGATLNLASLRYESIYVIGPDTGEMINIVYSEGVE